jgi:hypothetical protein
MKKAGAEYPVDSSATRLSRGDPVGFPSHPCGWFSIIVYLGVAYLLLGKIQISCHGKRQKPKGSIYNEKLSYENCLKFTP